MTNLNVIENKISSITQYVTFLKKYAVHSRQEIENDITLRGAVERYLYLAVQATINLAEATIAFKNLRKPTTYSESFEILKEADLIDAALAEKLMRMAGFRNVIAHDYEKIDFSVVYDALKNKMGDIEAFVTVIKKAL